jgi:hypothetical protein
MFTRSHRLCYSLSLTTFMKQKSGMRKLSKYMTKNPTSKTIKSQILKIQMPG